MKRRWMLAAALAATAAAAPGQTCTTQAKLIANVREAISDAALEAAQAIKSGDTAALAKLAAPDLASNFNATAYLARTTSEKLAGDSLRVAQIYHLDANGRTAGDSSETDFSCPLAGTGSETDFGIPGLPPGLYAFAMVEAEGEQPWVLSLLFRQNSGTWKLAGLYPHARTTGGHDGLWYWTDARAKAKAGQAWAAWLEYGEADELLRPANFVSSSHLDSLRDERSSAAPGELKDGLSATTPYAIKAVDGSTFSITSMALEPASDGTHMNLVAHFRADPLDDAAAAGRARNVVLGKALLAAHPELHALINAVTIFADTANQPPFATTVPITELN